MKTMPKSTQEEKLRWIKPILENKSTVKKMSEVCTFSKRSLQYWLANYRKNGIKGLENKSTRPKSCPTETPIRVKERIIELRKETNLSALKLKWKLEKENIHVHSRTIGKMIKKEGLVRKYRSRKEKLYIKREFKVGELVEIDVKYVPKKLKKQRYYQFTAIDSASRWRYLKIYENLDNRSSIDFLNELIKIAPFNIQSVKTDNGSCFTNRYTGYLKSEDPLNPKLHGFDLECMKLNLKHYLIDPGKPAQNGRVERSHRTDQEMFYNRTSFNTLKMLKYKLRLWNMYYNDLEHCSLNGLTPNQALRSRVQNVCA